MGGHPAGGLPLGVNNQGLFSDYYLTELVREDEFFRSSAKDAEAAWRAIRSVYEKVKAQLPTANEAQVEQLFIRPVLDVLGYKDSYAIQPDVSSPEGHRRPDYVFFANPDDLAAAEAGFKGRDEYFAKALAVGDAKAWDRSLDRRDKSGRDSFDKTAPSYQIDYYLRATDRKWGILTNGRRWRLYHRDTSYRMNVFYEVDLIKLLETYSADFLYFFAFFRKEAFVTGFLDRVLSGSRDYVAKVGRELKDNVYEALRILAEGFLKCKDNGLTEGDLEEIRENTFVLIYRLLFLFYAEDRGLLPLDRAEYRDSYSLRGLANEVARRLDEGRSFSQAAYGLWSRLGELFRIVNEGDPYLGVPPYNGGLFDHTKHSWLANRKISDHYLAQALDQLARAEAAGRTGRGPVSYRDLDIRDLGSIYEGLLEHRLRVATVDTAVVKEKDREVFIPLEKLGNRRPLRVYRAGEVYLETDKGERKSTGSYYTPDYVVKYIVEQTLSPLVEEKRQKIEEERRKLEEEYERARGANREYYAKKLSELEGRLIDEILSIKVLDPAMGSGHFLVGATDFLARALIEALGGAPEESDEDDVRWARREVVERCIYGVDLNPLAVELAKLSLWIYTTAKDRPLSFLDHHLRVGNSLIGAWIKDLGQLPRKGKKGKATGADKHTIGLFEGKLREKLPVVLGEVMELLRKPSDRVEDIREKEEIYSRILELLRPFKEVADVWTSTWFGVEVDEGDYEKMLLKLADPPAVWEEEIRSQGWFRRACEEAAQRRFFHWELEFPEVFFDEYGRQRENAGFDAVIGNPPYVRSVRLKEVDAESWSFCRLRFQVAAKREFDVYLCFVEQGYQLLSKDGRFGMILPNKWFTTQVGESLRDLLSKAAAVEHIVDFGSFQVFPEVTSYTCLLFLTGDTAENVCADVLVEAAASTSPLPGSEGNWRRCKIRSRDLGSGPWQFLPEETTSVWSKFQGLPRLEDVAVVFMGTGTRADQVYLMERRAGGFYSRVLGEVVDVEEELMRPALTGRDIDRYEYQRDNWLLFPYIVHGEDVILIPPKKMASRYPKAWKYINQPEVRTILEQRDQGKLVGDPLWYRYIYPRNMHRLGAPKIVFPDVAARGEFTYDDEGRYIIDTAYGIVLKEGVQLSIKTLTAILNSSLLTFFLQHTGTDLRGGYFRMKTAYLNPFPVPRVTFSTSLEQRKRLLSYVVDLYHKELLGEQTMMSRKEAFGELLAFMEAQPTDVVHDFLAFLAEEMIRLNKEKQAEMKNFLGWLEAELRIQEDKNGSTGIEALSGKTQLKNYLGDYQKNEPELSFEELWNILQKNKSRIGRKLTHEFMAELRDAYERSLAKLRPIKERLRLTDGLIDQIVYRLYGLTEQEIALVEGILQGQKDGDPNV